ncbi:zinc finger protein [Stylonychia lemnae]|uniref:Zinc finger protein n=1 Tax=Stylonychia lemnae TaxID=5949 RepID=A0A078B3V7_STYLE|nr:zinc finger protein [Stylonychia lemnae]|eukprot:CDW88906.1 zinc finger protein [Stylonychia lemnae]
MEENKFNQFQDEEDEVGSVVDIQQLKKRIISSTQLKYYSQTVDNYRLLKKLLFDLVFFILLGSLIYVIRSLQLYSKNSDLERKWLLEIFSFLMAFWFALCVIEILQYKCRIDTLNIYYFLFTNFILLCGIVVLVQYGVRSYEELDEDMKDHDNSYQDGFIHEAYLVMRYLGLAIALLHSITIIAFIHFAIKSKHRKFNFEQITSQQNKKLNSIQYEREAKGYIKGRLNGIPLRYLMIDEANQCQICLENFRAEKFIEEGQEELHKVMQLECNDIHIFHVDCLVDWMAAGYDYCPCCLSDIRL